MTYIFFFFYCDGANTFSRNCTQNCNFWILIFFSRASDMWSEKAMATNSSALAWKIPWTEEPGRLQSMGSQRVGYDWATSLSLFTFMHWRRKWQPTPVFLPGESQGWGAWWAAVYRVTQSRTRLKQLSSSSSSDRWYSTLFCDAGQDSETELPVSQLITVFQLLSCVQLFVTPWTIACQVSLSFIISQSLLMSFESVMTSNHLVLCHPLLLLLSIFPSIRVFFNESTLGIRWPKYWSFSFSISPSNEHWGLIFFRVDWFDLFAVQGTPKSLL